MQWWLMNGVIFGCSNYDKIAEFKRRVIEPVVKEINEQGEYELTLERKNRKNHHAFYAY